MADLMPGYDYHKPQAQKTYKEADLHLKFCRWVKKWYPDLKFIRHEKEGKRTKYMQNLILVYNNLDGIPDWELVHSPGFYIEFKKPGETWMLKTGVIKKQYQHQYECHKYLWSIGRFAYFCNDFEEAKQLLKDYLAGTPQKSQ